MHLHAHKLCGAPELCTRVEPCDWSGGAQGVTTMLGVSLRARRYTTQVMLGLSLRARWDTTLVPTIHQYSLILNTTVKSLQALVNNRSQLHIDKVLSDPMFTLKWLHFNSLWIVLWNSSRGVWSKVSQNVFTSTVHIYRQRTLIVWCLLRASLVITSSSSLENTAFFLRSGRIVTTSRDRIKIGRHFTKRSLSLGFMV